MKCPRCGKELYVDSHRKYDLQMCYECGYMEGRNYGSIPAAGAKHRVTNFERLRTMNENEAIAFIADGLHVDDSALRSWMGKAFA